MYCEIKEVAEAESAMAESRAALSIGGVHIAIAADRKLNLASEISQFQSSPCDPDIQVRVRGLDEVAAFAGHYGFDSGAVWKLSRDGPTFVVDFASSSVGSSPYKQLRTADFCNVELTMNRSLLPDEAWPLEYPADELLLTNYLARYGLGAEVHGCGLLDEGSGHLFLGHSGAGKSTSTRLWKSLRNAEVLSDDRIILRLHDGELWMYGTPWHGEAALASAGKAKLKRIFILQHGTRNRIVKLPKAQAVAELFARCFPPFHSAIGLQNTIEFLERAAEAAPVYEFQFVPDSTAVEMVANFRDK